MVCWFADVVFPSRGAVLLFLYPLAVAMALLSQQYHRKLVDGRVEILVVRLWSMICRDSIVPVRLVIQLKDGWNHA